jgi:CRISPR-associated protein (TIGR02710 family)
MTNAQQASSDSPRPRAIIMTVGLTGDQGGDVLDALQLDLEATKPEYLALIASTQSIKNAQRMVDRAGLPAEQTEIVEVASANDIGAIFQRMNDLVQRMGKRGFSPDEIAINYTSGTKVMGAGAVLSAVYNRIMELRYITGLNAGVDARHRIVTTKPGAVLAYQQMLAGRRMMLDLHHTSARNSLADVAEDLLSPDDRTLLADLRLLSEAYESWDSFFPDRFLQLYDKVSFKLDTLDPFRLTAEQLNHVGELAAEIKAGHMGQYVITDLYNNAVRRLQMGRSEDAIARVYRALEMLAQWVLQRDFEIDTNDVDTRVIPPRERVGYEALRSTEDGLVKIGMRKSFELLNTLTSPLGEQFAKDTVMRQFMEHRADSILAHGLLPLPAEEARLYVKQAITLFEVEIQDFAHLSQRMQFPWITH